MVFAMNATLLQRIGTTCAWITNIVRCTLLSINHFYEYLCFSAVVVFCMLPRAIYSPVECSSLLSLLCRRSFICSMYKKLLNNFAYANVVFVVAGFGCACEFGKTKAQKTRAFHPAPYLRAPRARSLFFFFIFTRRTVKIKLISMEWGQCNQKDYEQHETGINEY